MGFPLINPILQFFDNSGNVLNGGLLYTYASDGVTPKTTWSDADLSSANENPIELDSAGRCTIFVVDGEEYYLVLKTSAGVTLKTIEEVRSPREYYETTARETTAEVTPANKAYPELDSRRYSTLAQCFSVLGSTTEMRSGRVRIVGNNAVTSTLLLDRKCALVHGDGPGTFDTGTGGVIAGAIDNATPVLEIKRCLMLELADFRIYNIGSGSGATALIKYTSTLAESPVNSHNKVRNITFNGFALDSVPTAVDVDNGILVDGANLQGDQSSISDCLFQGLGNACIKFGQSQNVLWHVDTCIFNSAAYGVEINTRFLLFTNCFAQTLGTADYYMPSDGSCTVINSGSELGGRLVYAIDGFSCYFQNFYFQAGANTTASGRIVDLTGNTTGSIIMMDGGFVNSSAPVTLKFYVRAAQVYVHLRNVGLPETIDTFLDIAPIAGGTAVVILENVVDSTGARFDGSFKWSFGQTAPIYSTWATGKLLRGVREYTSTWDPGSTANGAFVQTSFAATGAVRTDYKLGESFSTISTGWYLDMIVCATDTLAAKLTNNTGGVDDLGSGTLAALVMQRPV